jgi:hypothetical protein
MYFAILWVEMKRSADSKTLIAADRAYLESGGSFKALLDFHPFVRLVSLPQNT